MIRPTPIFDVLSFFDTLGPTMTLPVNEARTSRGARAVKQSRMSGLAMDCYATNDQAVVLASLPGIHPDDISVSVEKNTLTVTGRVTSDRKQWDEHGEPVTWYLSEIPRGTYERSIRLPFAVEEDKVEAQFSNGMLRIVLPKVEAAKPRKVAVQILESRFPEITAESEDAETLVAD